MCTSNASNKRKHNRQQVGWTRRFAPRPCCERYTDMNKFIALLLMFSSSVVFAGGDEFDVRVLSFSQIGESEYQFEFTQLSQPYGREHLKDQNFILKLRYKCEKLICNSNILSKPVYKDAIALLQQQAITGNIIKFGIMGGGYKHISGNTYQSNALKVYDNVAYSFEHH